MVSYQYILLIIWGLILIISTPSWLSCWVGLEMMTMGFIPMILMESKSWISSAVAWKYFLIQAISSGLFLVSLIGSAGGLIGGGSDSILNQLQFLGILFSILLKLGIFPFHGWAIEVGLHLGWKVFIFFSTVQKIGPLMIIAYSTQYVYDLNVILFVATASAVFSILCMYEVSINKIFIHSSLLSLGWVLVGLLSHIFFFSVVYFLIYSVSLFILFTIFNLEGMKELSDLFSNYNLNFYSKLASLLIAGSLLGVPPFASFFPKVLILKSLSSFSIISPFLLLSSSVLMVMIYFPLFIFPLFSSSKSFFLPKSIGWKTISFFSVVSIHVSLIFLSYLLISQ